MNESNLNWQHLLDRFREINDFKDLSQQEYELYQLAKQYEMSLETLEKIFVLYQEKTERERLKSNIPLVGSLLVQLESWLDRIHHSLKMMAIFPILEQLAKLSLIVGLVLFITECTGRSNERNSQRLQTHYEAWNIIKTHEEKDRSSGGRKEAIEYLSNEGIDLSGTNLINANLERIKINQTPVILKMFGLNHQKIRFLWINLENAVLNEGDFSDSLLYFANFKQAQLWKTKFNNSALARANFEGADLEGANLENADLRCTSFLKVKYIEAEQVQKGNEWQIAIYNPGFASKKLKLPIRNQLDIIELNILDNNSLNEKTIDEHEELKTLHFHCYGFQVDYDRDNKESNLKKLHNRFDIFLEYVNDNLKNADFRYAYLDGVNLSGTNLENANLSDAYLNRTKFEGANLRNANLVKAKKLTVDQIILSCNWNKAKLDEEIEKKLQSRKDKPNANCSKWNRD